MITHHILDGKQKEYENWLDEIVPISEHSKGLIDLQIVRPIPKMTFVYTVIIRFDTIDHLKSWMESPDRKKLIEKASPYFRKNDRYQIKSGLDFLFNAENEDNRVPVRWKQPCNLVCHLSPVVSYTTFAAPTFEVAKHSC